MALTAALDRVYGVSRNPNFQQRLQVALIDQVATVAGEAGATTNHANRIAFAAQVAYSPDSWAAKMALGIIVTNTNIQNALTTNNPDTNTTAVADADIKTAVGVVWNFYADAEVALQTATKVI